MHAHYVSAVAGRWRGQAEEQASRIAVLCDQAKLACDKGECKLGNVVRMRCGMNLIAAPPRVRLLEYAFLARLRRI